MQLSIQKAIELANACSEVTKDITIAFKVRYAIGRTLGELKAAITAYDDERSNIIMRYAEGKGKLEPDHKNYPEAMKELIALEKNQITIAEHRFTEEEFLSKEPALSSNTIAVLSQLFSK